MTRVLITGSRSWTDRYTIAGHLDRLTHESGDLLVIHGDAQGADRIARDRARMQRAQGFPIAEHAMPAKWDVCGEACDPAHRRVGPTGREFCPTAGHRRNAEMVALGTDLCLAFVRDCDSARCRKPRPHPSHGADHCARLAEAAGIPTVRVTWDEATA